jgi:hypothetical protein
MSSGKVHPPTQAAACPVAPSPKTSHHHCCHHHRHDTFFFPRYVVNLTLAILLRFS